MWKEGAMLSKPGGCSAVESSVFPQGRSPLHTVLPFTGGKVFQELQHDLGVSRVTDICWLILLPLLLWWTLSSWDSRTWSTWIATFSSLTCSSLPVVCFLGLFLCASLTVKGHGIFALCQLLSEPHTHPLAGLWDFGDCHITVSPWQLLASGSCRLSGMAAHLDPTGALCKALGPLSLLCNHQGVREWIPAPPGLWPSYSSRVQKFPSAFWPCKCCAGDLFSMPGWTGGACPQALPRWESASVLRFGSCLSFQRESFYYYTTVHITE